MSNPLPLQASVQTAPRLRRLDVGELLGPAREIILTHQGEEYRLRITSNRRLILTK